MFIKMQKTLHNIFFSTECGMTLTGSINLALKGRDARYNVCSRSRGFPTSVLQRCMTGNCIDELIVDLKLDLGTHKERWSTKQHSVSGQLRLKQIFIHTNILHVQAPHRNPSSNAVRPFPTILQCEKPKRWMSYSFNAMDKHWCRCVNVCHPFHCHFIPFHRHPFVNSKAQKVLGEWI